MASLLVAEPVSLPPRVDGHATPDVPPSSEGPGTEQVTIPKRYLQELFDLAVNSMDFGSGYWDNDDVVTGRAVAEVLGVDPATATPSEFRKYFAHPFEKRDHSKFFPSHFVVLCRACTELEEHVAHHGVSLGVTRPEDVLEG
jgi:hypothetical protein